MSYPEDLKYSEEHIWVNIKDDLATIGITKFASEELNDILAVDLPHTGDTIDQGESFGTLESSKTVSELYAPVSGEVIEVNSDAIDDPGIINEYTYDDGWLIKVKLSDEDETVALLSSAKYEAFILEESDAEPDEDDEYDDED